MMRLGDEIYKLGEEQFAIILKCLLDRIPILIAGIDSHQVEYFANNLADLMSFREKALFYTDFISKEELDLLLEQEEADYDTRRTVIVCPNNGLQKALSTFSRFKSWILCYCVKNEQNIQTLESFNSKLSSIIRMIQKKEETFLLIEDLNNEIRVNLIGKKDKFADLKFEKYIHNCAIKFVDNSVSKMKRIFVQRLTSLKNLSHELKAELLDFSFEEINLKKNMFKIQILEFYNAARRAFSILNKISILNSLNIEIEISDKTLLDTISYLEASHFRLIEFIDSEWGEYFSENIDSEPIKYKHDLIESLWG